MHGNSFMNISVGEIAELVGGTVVGDAAQRIAGLNGIRDAQPGDLTFLANLKHGKDLAKSQASAVLARPDLDAWTGVIIHVTDPYYAFTKLLAWRETQLRKHHQGIHPTAVVDADAKVGENVALGPHVCIESGACIGDGSVLYANVYVGRDSSIGADTVIYANVSIRERISVGARCILHSGVVLGSDGFGFLAVEGRRHKIPHIGTVVIGDDVELGANTAVDRATCGTTLIENGTKIDNLVQIGHNSRIGPHCVIAGQSGVAGSAVVGEHVTIAAQCGIAGHLVVGDHAVVGAKSGVTNTIAEAQIVSGYPAIDHKHEKRVKASLRNLPQMGRRLKQLEQRIHELEDILHAKTEDHS